MTISLYTLAVTGPGKKTALLELSGKSHLIFGPTDSGKSYIVECLRYCLGSSQRPKDIGFSEGYTQLALQVCLHNGDKFTLFRDLTGNGEVVYPGFHISPPINAAEPLEEKISELIPSWCNGREKKILIKSGVLGNLAAGDYRKTSIFDEIETLDNTPFEGKDSNLKTRNRSNLSLILTGTDDSQMILVPSTEQRSIAKGHIEALEEQISNLLLEIPSEITKEDAEQALGKLSTEIESISQYFQENEKELSLLKEEGYKIEREIKNITQHLSALYEASDRFQLLSNKYQSDLNRLQTLGTAVAVISNFVPQSCPLCLTDLEHQKRHQGNAFNLPILRQAAQAESHKIHSLMEGLNSTIFDVKEEIQEYNIRLEESKKEMSGNISHQNILLSPQHPNTRYGLPILAEHKTELTLILNNFERIDSLNTRLIQMKERTKKKKQIIKRDISQSATNLCIRVKELLDSWAVPDVRTVSFNESISDIEINQRARISFGKGKRGIFLTAYMVALMEKSIINEFPHFGFVIIDSPVVTYKDPKHSIITDKSELLDIGVKDRFYTWLIERTEPGQIIILENEEPSELQKKQLYFTEFLGAGNVSGRSGFFPI